jgi:hypothetical protein
MNHLKDHLKPFVFNFPIDGKYHTLTFDKDEQEQNKTPLDKVFDVLGESGKFVKNILIFGVIIYAVGYLAPKFQKK